MNPIFSTLVENLDDRLKAVRESGPMPDDQFQVFVLMTLKALIEELESQDRG
ncbi:MAG: hypothetical protein WC045_01795 [Patescibacteria group bacterium]